MTRPARRVVATALAFALGAAAGAARAESIFGLYFLGERFDVGDARVTGLGGFVQTIDDSLGVLQYNPAAVAWSKRVSFGVAGYFTSDANRSADTEERVNATKLTTFSFAFPLYRKRVTAAFGYRGRYDPDGGFRLELESPDGDPYTDVFERSGGLFSVPITVAFDAGDYGKLGLFYSFERGKIESRWIKDFEPGNDAVSTEERRFSGYGLGAGFLTRPLPRLSVGLSYEAQIDYDVEVNETYTSASADTSYDEDAVLPPRMTLSASFRASRGLVIYAGGSVCDFRDFEGLDFPRERLAREQVAALGLEYRFNRSRIPIRASLRYERLPYTLPEGEAIRRYAVTVGSGLLLRGGKGRVDTALQFGFTGSTDTNQYEDRSVRVYVSVTGSEDWKRARDRRE